MLGLLYGIGAFVLTVAVITIIVSLTLDVLKRFRTRSGTEIVTVGMKDMIKQARKSGTTMSMDELEAFEDKMNGANYLISEYDPYEEEVIKVEGAEKAEKKIETAVENANNGVLVIT